MSIVGRDRLKAENNLFRQFFRQWKAFERANEYRRTAPYPGDAVRDAQEKEAAMDATAAEIEKFLAESPDGK